MKSPCGAPLPLKPPAAAAAAACCCALLTLQCSKTRRGNDKAAAKLCQHNVHVQGVRARSC
jgi:hypothetical protein